MKTQDKISVLLAGMLIILTGCASSSGSSRNEQTQNNMVNKSEKKQGWVSLFDGNTLTGWRTYQNKKTDSWSVSDGTIHCNPGSMAPGQTRADLMTIDQFENFELVIDWKIAPKGNSGIIYLLSEKHAQPYLTGPEYQLIDDTGYPAKLEDWQKTGANYAMNPPTSLAAKPAGEWNTTRILVNKGHVEHWLNGVKVVEYEMWTDKWKQEKATGKWKDAPDYGTVKKGHISLQDHGDEAWFRNIKIRTL
jgi:hypothetical protein